MTSFQAPRWNEVDERALKRPRRSGKRTAQKRSTLESGQTDIADSATSTVKILLVAADPADALLVRETLEELKPRLFRITEVDRLETALKRLEKPSHDIVLVDLTLPDSAGLDTYRAIRAKTNLIPVLVLFGAGEESLAAQAVQEGAQDSLLKNQLTSPLLARAIRYSIDRKRLEDELRGARQAAESSARAKAAFVANISHEIRTPLNGLIGMAELLLDTPLRKVQRDYAATISSSAEALLAIIGDIIDFARLEAGRMEIEPADLNLRTVMEEVADLFAPRAHQKRLQISCVMPAGFPERLVGDPVRLRQILTNLVGNAVKFTEEGEVVVAATLLAEHEQAVTFRLSVRDTGIGIAAGQREGVFESFSKAQSTLRKSDAGIGLGLSICRHLARLMGADLELESEPGLGSTFWFDLTLPRSATTGAPSGVTGTCSGLRALVVDGDATSRSVLCDHIRSWGGQCDQASTASEALARLQAGGSELYGLVILGLKLPDADGTELAAELRRQPALAAIPRLLVYALGLRGAERSDWPQLFAGTLTKPIRRSQLQARIAGILHPQEEVDPAPGACDSEDAAALGLRVLVVEDLEINRKVALRMLKQLGCEAHAVENGRDALRALERQSYDAVLMDVQMPVMDGLEATCEIRRRQASPSARTPIVAMTAHAMEGDRQRCLAAGMDGYVAKPVKKKELLAALSQWAKPAVPPARAERAPLQNRSPSRLRFSRLQESCGDNPPYLKAVLNAFLIAAPRTLASMEQALTAEDFARMAAEAQELLGLCQKIGADALAAAAADLVGVRMNPDPLRMLNAFEQARSDLGQLRPEIEQLIRCL